MSKQVTVNDIRRAIQDLPGHAIVTVHAQTGREAESWRWQERTLSLASGARDGRLGPVLFLQLDGFIAPFGSRIWDKPSFHERMKALGRKITNVD